MITLKLPKYSLKAVFFKNLDMRTRGFLILYNFDDAEQHTSKNTEKNCREKLKNAELNLKILKNSTKYH